MIYQYAQASICILWLTVFLLHVVDTKFKIKITLNLLIWLLNSLINKQHLVSSSFVLSFEYVLTEHSSFDSSPYTPEAEYTES